MRTKLREIFGSDPLQWMGKEVTVCGWIRTARGQKSVTFLEVNDGTTALNLQVVIGAEIDPDRKLLPLLTTGSSVKIRGSLLQSPGKNQALELRAEVVEVIGFCDPARYPLQKKEHSFEFLRTIAHLRPRTQTQGAVLRVRSALAMATHLFFQERGFFYVHTPIITGSDCEGGGEMFRLAPTPDNEGKAHDFFGKPAYLTVSGQLEGEILALALSDIYTFGPTFRAENSNTSRHLAEFWMIEPEMAFADLEDDIECAESYLKYCVRYVMAHCKEELSLFERSLEPGLLARLEQVISHPFARIPYTEAIDILKKAPRSFVYPVAWGVDLQSEHERFLAEEYCKKPVVVTDYPKELKAFYMRENPDGKTVAAMDLLVSRVGELIGGSQREERLDVLEHKIASRGLRKEDYWWYLELRDYGTVPHAGFGLGFERLLLFVTGMENIRDVIPFPRFPNHAEF
ncbi:MAG: asparagine--tRNA ligase [Verrucomicrobiota bacterium]|nr:asparagine--tRNA ligase [Verrucomicrobiota bacterium]